HRHLRVPGRLVRRGIEVGPEQRGDRGPQQDGRAAGLGAQEVAQRGAQAAGPRRAPRPASGRLGHGPIVVPGPAAPAGFGHGYGRGIARRASRKAPGWVNAQKWLAPSTRTSSFVGACTSSKNSTAGPVSVTTSWAPWNR